MISLDHRDLRLDLMLSEKEDPVKEDIRSVKNHVGILKVESWNQV